ncbi:hypothetical protein Mapa_018516 [Marchantia paleacea]|nr:hypothetical protein Mapa_018516 [Marchantia paleacea]
MRDAEMETAQAAGGEVEGEQNGGATDHVENGSRNKGHHAVSFSHVKPHLVIQAPKAAEAIVFYKAAFGAEEVTKTVHAKRKAEQEQPLILHAHLKFGDTEILIFDETEETGNTVKSTSSLNGTSMILHLETPDVETAFSRAIEAGATVSEQIADRPWGQRYGKLIDPYGFVWSLASPLAPEETSVIIAEEAVEAGQAA